MLLQFLRCLRSGEKTGEELRDLCLHRIMESDADIQAWVEVSPQPALDAGPLSGIPFGAKDIFETRGMATEYGSPLYAGRKGNADSTVITDLRKAGAVLLGKTHTAAFASFDPAPTRNPRLPGHTPGGSSSGSAAAVAAGMVPFALGTQTLGSVVRPASYCGVCGFKPTFGLLPIDGVLPFAPSLDTVGLFTQKAADMAELWTLGFGGRVHTQVQRAAFVPLPSDDFTARTCLEAVARLNEAGFVVDVLELPAGWARLCAAACTINEYEGARTHRARFMEFGERMGVRLAELIRRGLAVPDAEYEEARGTVQEMNSMLHGMFWEWAAILSPAATGIAPAGFASTGDPSNNASWTALGVPAISVPLPAEQPVGLQIAAAWGRDDALLAVACEVERLVGTEKAAR